MTYDELQTFGAIAGWPKCRADRKDKICGRVYDPEWPNTYAWGQYCPLPGRWLGDDRGEVACCDFDDAEWMQFLEEHLEKHGIEL
jgi:hypothetical protein